MAARAARRGGIEMAMSRLWNPFGVNIIRAGGGGSMTPAEGLLTTLLTGLECYWALGEASGATRADSHGVENLANNGTVGHVLGVAGLGLAASFSGNTSNYLSKTDDPNLCIAGAPATFNVWCNLTNKTNTQVIFAKLDGTHYGYQFYYNQPDDRFHFDVGDGATTLIGSTNASTFGSPSPATWYMCTCYYDPANARVGVQVNGGTIDWTATTGTAGDVTVAFTVGRASSAGAFALTGAVQAFSLYKKILSSVEVTALYNGGLPYPYPFLGKTRADSYGSEHLSTMGSVGQTAGKLAQAALFNGVCTNLLGRASDAVLQAGDIDYSFNAWVQIANTTSSHMLLAKWSAGAGGEYELFYYTTDHRFHFDAGNGAAAIGTVVANTFGAPSAGTLYMVSCGHSATNNQVWISVNGGAKDTAATTGAAAVSADGFTVGFRYSTTPLSCNGVVDAVGYWKKELSAGELTALYNAGSGLSYPFTGTASLLTGLQAYWGMDDADGALYSTVDTTDSGGVDIRVLVPGNHAVGASYPVVLYHHGQGETYTAVTADTLKLGVVRNLLGNGYIVAGSSQHGNSWGSDAGTADMLHLYNYIIANYGSTLRTIQFSQSAGGPSGLLCSTVDFAVPLTKGWFGIYPCCDLAWCYANGFDADIDTAYGIDGTPYATATAGHDPVLLAATKFDNLRMRFYASDGDLVVHKPDNTDVLRTLVTGHATELALVTCTGTHGDPTHFRPTDVSAFCARCI